MNLNVLKQVENDFHFCFLRGKEKTLICREKSEAAGANKQKQVKKGAANKETKKREEIKRLLEESGTESSWIMQYEHIPTQF